MSLNFIETLLDKFLPKDSENSLLKNWTGSQNFLGSKMSISDSILYKYQEALLDANDNVLLNHSIKRSPLESTMFPYHQNMSSNSLVSRVSKLFFPATPGMSFHDYCRKNQEINTNHKVSMNKINHPQDNLWEEFMQEAFNIAVNITKYHSNNFGQMQNPNCSSKQPIDMSELSDTIATICTGSFVDKIPEMVAEIIESVPSQLNKNHIKPKIIVEIPASSSTQMKDKNLEELKMTVNANSNNDTVQKNKKLIANNGTLNQELANRKTKELQKRSRNRRRRQKRSNKSKDSMQKNSSIIDDQKPILEKSNVAYPTIPRISCGLLNNVEKCADADSSTLCNVIKIADNANSVQIILPNVSSFVIMVGSDGDDSDWDENSDSDWLNDTSEFECSGLNVANLPSSKPTLLSVPPHHDEDLEELQLNMLLCRVNKEWNEATKDLDEKSRSSTKVSFVPDDELVEVLPVELYDRKGEWEMYALERLRFKKRIDELDKIISPCLSVEHREKVMQKYYSTDL